MLKSLALLSVVFLFLSFVTLFGENLQLLDNKFGSFVTDAEYISDNSILVTFRTGLSEFALKGGIPEKTRNIYLPGDVFEIETQGEKIYTLSRSGDIHVIAKSEKNFTVESALNIGAEPLHFGLIGENIVCLAKGKLLLLKQPDPQHIAVVATLSFAGNARGMAIWKNELFVCYNDTIIGRFGFDEKNGFIQKESIAIPKVPEYIATNGTRLFAIHLGEGISSYKFDGDVLKFETILGSEGNFYSSLTCDDSLLFASAMDYGVQVFNVNENAKPSLLADYFDGKISQRCIRKGENIILINSEMGFELLKISAKKELKVIAEYDPKIRVLDVEWIRKFVAVGLGPSGLSILDPNDNFREVATYNPGGFVRSIFPLGERFLFVTVESGFVDFLAITGDGNVMKWNRMDVETPFAVAANGRIVALSSHGNQSVRFFRMDVRKDSKLEPVAEFPVGGIGREFVIKDSLCFAACDKGGIFIFNISNPDSISLITNIKSGGHTRGIFIRDTLLFAACGEEGVLIYNISNPASPAKISQIRDTPASSVSCTNNLLSVSLDDKGLYLYNITDPLNPVAVGNYRNSGLATKVISFGKFILMADQYSLYIFKIIP